MCVCTFYYDGREVCGVHELTVSCRDRGRREKADFARVTVTVMDANDHDPTFLDTMITAKVIDLPSTHHIMSLFVYFSEDI